MSKRRDYLLFASRVLSKCFFLGSTVSSGTHAPSTLLNREISSISTCSLSFFFTNLPFTVECYSCLWVMSFKLLIKKSDNTMSCVFTVVYPHGERMFEEGISMNRIVHVGLPYTLRGSTLSKLLIMPVRGLRRSDFIFSPFFCESVETENDTRV